jgi:hypothetical protein
VSRYGDEVVTKKVLEMLKAEPIPPEQNNRVKAIKKHFFGVTILRYIKSASSVQGFMA